MIELNAEQRQAMAQGEALHITDPLTHEAYVLVPADVYARLAGATRRPAGEPHPEISAHETPFDASVLAGPAPTPPDAAES